MIPKGQTGKGLRVFGVAAFLCGAIVVGCSIVERDTEQTLASRGVRTTGLVTYRGAEDSSDDNRTRHVDYYLVVEYPAGRPVDTNRFFVHESDWVTRQPGSTVGVLYDPYRPHVARLTGGIDRRSSTESFIFGGILAALGIGVLVWAYKTDKDEDSEAPDIDEALMLARRGRR